MSTSEESTTDIEASQYFRCSFEGCTRVFKRKDRLETHSRVHTGERPFVCSIGDCKKSYARSQHLKRHIESSHTPKDESSSNIKFSCPICNRELANVYSLQNHVKREHKDDNEPKPYKCTEVGCVESFHKKKQLVNHKLKEHTGHLLEARKCHRCPHEGCDKVFVWNKLLKRHMKVHQGYPCDSDGCGQVFPNWSSLRKHKAQDHKPAITCEQCGITFARKSSLTQHMKCKHGESRQTFNCPVEGCRRVYNYKSNLKMHIRESHEGKDIWRGRERKQKSAKKKAKIPLEKISLAAKLCGLDDRGETLKLAQERRPPLNKTAQGISGVSSSPFFQDQVIEETTSSLIVESSQSSVLSTENMPNLIDIHNLETSTSSSPIFDNSEPMLVEYKTDLLKPDASCDKNCTEIICLIPHEDRVEQTTAILKKIVNDLKVER